MFALTNVCATRANHPQLLESGIVSLMAQLMEDQDTEIRNAGCFAIANLASNSNNHDTIIREGCLVPLIAFTAAHDPQAQLRGVQALRGLSTTGW